MTSYIPYIPSVKSFENLDLSSVKRKKFHSLKHINGNGPAEIKIISPTKQDVDRAKVELKRGSAINSMNNKNAPSSSISTPGTKKRAKVTQVKTKRKYARYKR